MSNTSRRTRLRRTIPTAALTALVGAAPLVAAPATAHAAPSDCPVVHAVLVPGTSETTSDADPTIDTGLLSTVSIPVSVAQPGFYDRTYVTYPADFGWGGVPYLDSVAEGVRQTMAVIDQVAAACADQGTQIAISGFSQGAHIARAVAQAIGRGTAGVDPDIIASVSLFSDPGRAAGDGWFPGLPGQTTPAPAVGTDGENVGKVRLADVAPAAGRGIAPIDDGTFGDLDGRVTSFCLTGDLACSVPEDAPVARLVAAVAGQLDLSDQDPVRILTDITGALSGAVVNTVAGTRAATAGEAATARTLGEVAAALTGETATAAVATTEVAAPDTTTNAPAPATTLAPATTEEQRRGLVPIDLGDPLRPLAEFGNFLFGAAVTVAREVITPASIGELAMVGLANPDAALAVLGQKLIGATAEVLPTLSGAQRGAGHGPRPCSRRHRFRTGHQRAHHRSRGSGNGHGAGDHDRAGPLWFFRRLVRQ